MKRLLLCVSILMSVCVLSGCPIYSTSPDSQACGPDGCYDCPAGTSPSDGACIPWACTSSSDCPSGFACNTSNRGGYCIPVSGSTTSPDAGDCSGGCPSGYVCKLSGGQTQCVLPGHPATDGGSPVDASVPDSGVTVADGPFVEEDSALWTKSSDASDASEAAMVSDGSVATDASDAASSADVVTAVACNATADCVGGATCVNGVCTPQIELCSDTTQCVVAGGACVNGICEPHCSASAPCPSGYECDFTRAVCNLNPSPCAGSGTANCQGGSTCVEGRCVAPCASGDSGGICPGGQVCVNGGCIPNEAATFTCKNDGQSGTLATTCDSTQICLHHDCYAACDPDAASPCADPSASCQSVTVNAGTYIVCAAAATLGSDCDVAAGKPCSSGFCIDGYCR